MHTEVVCPIPVCATGGKDSPGILEEGVTEFVSLDSGHFKGLTIEGVDGGSALEVPGEVEEVVQGEGVFAILAFAGGIVALHEGEEGAAGEEGAIFDGDAGERREVVQVASGFDLVFYAVNSAEEGGGVGSEVAGAAAGEERAPFDSSNADVTLFTELSAALSFMFSLPPSTFCSRALISFKPLFRASASSVILITKSLILPCLFRFSVYHVAMCIITLFALGFLLYLLRVDHREHKQKQGKSSFDLPLAISVTFTCGTQRQTPIPAGADLPPGECRAER